LSNFVSLSKSYTWPEQVIDFRQDLGIIDFFFKDFLRYSVGSASLEIPPEISDMELSDHVEDTYLIYLRAVRKFFNKSDQFFGDVPGKPRGFLGSLEEQRRLIVCLRDELFDLCPRPLELYNLSYFLYIHARRFYMEAFF